MLRKTATSLIVVIATLFVFGFTAAAQQKFGNGPGGRDTVVTALPDEIGGARLDGRGFSRWETVRIEVTLNPTTFSPEILLGQWDQAADERGYFVSFWQGAALPGRVVITATGVSSGRTASDSFFYEGPIVLGSGGSLEQCGNGPQLVPVPCTGSAWQNGNLNENQAHYAEGESVPYRIRFTGVDTSISHTVTIEWDTTEGGKHALDYITSYNRTETNADPCSGVVGCDPTVYSTYAIPIDDWVTAGHDGVPGNDDDIGQIPGVFTLYNGTITGVTAYYRTGTYTASSKTGIQIKFTSTTDNPVLAWGGHISTRMDWGVGNSAIAIQGAPYHMRVIEIDGSPGNQDRSLSASAAIFPGSITIIKVAEPETGMPFTFTAEGPGVTDFTLDDDGQPEVNYPDRIKFEGLTFFGTTNRVTITEAAMPGIFSVGDILCTSEANGGTGTNNNTVSLVDQKVVITLEEGEAVTCTFVNLVAVPTAGGVSVSGRVIGTNTFGVGRVELLLYPADGSPPYRAVTNPFGYYSFTGVPVGKAYVLTLGGKGYTFDPASMVLTIGDNIADLDFIAISDW
ncbi:MAG TPA: carboxypeptidase-like regulatory domain-containing protein [Pyrinomonadaceae bacterium]|nr:carboxypeptidase-like regulatory domain-containing protein [Pyrinomonadaceae bacterium]